MIKPTSLLSELDTERAARRSGATVPSTPADLQGRRHDHGERNDDELHFTASRKSSERRRRSKTNFGHPAGTAGELQDSVAVDVGVKHESNFAPRDFGDRDPGDSYRPRKRSGPLRPARPVVAAH
jgi:hypothetical protein